ncbi:MAG TPA: EF-hand domain-containing protein [Oscillatoriaceae cyanobacterium]
MKKLTLTMAAAAMMTAMLAGCGTSGMMVPYQSGLMAAPLQAESTTALEQGFLDIYMAEFNKLDANSDNYVDEYEAGPAVDLNDFQKADANRDHRLSRTEFMRYADQSGLFGFLHQNKNQFMQATRNALYGAFQKLDKNHDRLIEENEMSDSAMKKVGIYLAIPSLHVKVVLDTEDTMIFSNADKTGDSKLSQAEFEDYCMDAFLKGINPSYNPNPAPPAPPASGAAM